jgi:hypothetical protein
MFGRSGSVADTPRLRTRRSFQLAGESEAYESLGRIEIRIADSSQFIVHSSQFIADSSRKASDVTPVTVRGKLIHKSFE